MQIILGYFCIFKSNKQVHLLTYLKIFHTLKRLNCLRKMAWLLQMTQFGESEVLISQKKKLNIIEIVLPMQ